MPHICLELSKNVLEKDTLEPLFQDCHKVLVETLPTNLASCKSRSYMCSAYHIADGHPKNAFVHMSVRIMPGRAQAVIDKTGEALMGLLKNHFAGSLEVLNLQLSLDISDLAHYVKFQKLESSF